MKYKIQKNENKYSNRIFGKVNDLLSSDEKTKTFKKINIKSVF